MAKSANLYIRIDPEVKAEVEAIYSQYGMTLTEAINIFLYQSRNIGGLPFDLRPKIPNAETLAAMKEANDISKGAVPSKSYKNARELFDELDAEE